MHVLGIHMNAMPTTALSEEWGTLTGLWAFNKTDETLKMMLKKNDVPILLQDPLALVIHFILLLPVNIDKAYFVDTTSSSYSKATGRHTLHYEYSGNVERMASCHNFIMETRDKQKTMQMGKFDKCQYLLDVHHPLTPLQALFLAISHFNG